VFVFVFVLVLVFNEEVKKLLDSPLTADFICSAVILLADVLFTELPVSVEILASADLRIVLKSDVTPVL